jgi:hypothetical protein
MKDTPWMMSASGLSQVVLCFDEAIVRLTSKYITEGQAQAIRELIYLRKYYIDSNLIKPEPIK